MKRLLYKIEDWIAVRFLKREFKKEFAGKVLALCYEKLLKEAIDQDSTQCELTYTFVYKNKTYLVKSAISIIELNKEEVSK